MESLVALTRRLYRAVAVGESAEAAWEGPPGHADHRLSPRPPGAPGRSDKKNSTRPEIANSIRCTAPWMAPTRGELPTRAETARFAASSSRFAGDSANTTCWPVSREITTT